MAARCLYRDGLSPRYRTNEISGGVYRGSGNTCGEARAAQEEGGMGLRSAYFQDFKDGPKGLFWGDAKAMSDLADLLRASSVGTGPLTLGSFSEAIVPQDNRYPTVLSIRWHEG
jgi:hypothetical protein